MIFFFREAFLYTGHSKKRRRKKEKKKQRRIRISLFNLIYSLAPPALTLWRCAYLWLRRNLGSMPLRDLCLCCLTFLMPLRWAV